MRRGLVSASGIALGIRYVLPAIWRRYFMVKPCRLVFVWKYNKVFAIIAKVYAGKTLPPVFFWILADY